MSPSETDPPRPSQAGADVPSYGNMGPHHWSKTRTELNEEAIEYYRERSRAPGVESGGGPRNFYCMDCDGVIPYDQAQSHCPHCGAELDGEVRRYFNWVEIDRPPESDLRSLLPWFAGVFAVFAALVWFVFLR